MHAEVGDALDGGRNGPANGIVNTAFRVVLLHYNHISPHFLDVLPNALHVQRLQREDV
jgi:hypothetical protein